MEDTLLKIHDFAGVAKELLNRSPVNLLDADIQPKNKFSFWRCESQTQQFDNHIYAVETEMTTLKQLDIKIQAFLNEIDHSKEDYRNFLLQLLAQTDAVQQSDAHLRTQIQNANGNLEFIRQAFRQNQTIRQEVTDNVRILYYLSHMQYNRINSTID
jgi:hypothetical protein